MELTEALKQEVGRYRVTPEDLEPIRQAPILLAVGITGAGKNTTLHYLLEHFPARYKFIVTHKTRQLRPSEHQGVDFYHIDFSELKKMIDNHEFIEVNIVHADHVYGTSIAEVKRLQEDGKIACTDLTTDGVDDFMRLGLNAKAVFLLPPDYDTWKQRLFGRAGTVDLVDFRNRLESALVEIEHALSLDYYYIVINDNLEETAQLVHEIAEGQPVEPHYHKAMKIAEELVRRIKEELAKLEQV